MNHDLLVFLGGYVAGLFALGVVWATASADERRRKSQRDSRAACREGVSD